MAWQNKIQLQKNKNNINLIDKAQIKGPTQTSIVEMMLVVSTSSTKQSIEIQCNLQNN
jgi:hypothetical protein